MSRIRNPTWENDENLKADIQKYVLQNLTRKEVLDFLGRDYPQYAWSLPTLSRRMAYFEIKYVDYETDLKVVEMAVKEEISGPGQLLGYRSMHQYLIVLLVRFPCDRVSSFNCSRTSSIRSFFFS